MRFLKSLLKFFQILAVVMIPLVTIQYYFNMSDILENINLSNLQLLSKIIPLTSAGIDYTLIYLIFPWVLFVILCGLVINFMDSLKKKAREVVSQYKTQKTKEMLMQKTQAIVEGLKKYSAIYLVIQLNFAKFTITNISENELKEIKNDVKENIYNSLSEYKGKILEYDDMENEDTTAMIFSSQEDVLEFLFKLKEKISLFDDDMQQYGYSISFGAILDAQLPDVSSYKIIPFLEKILKTLSVNEISATNHFADRYKNYGAMKHISFISKGTYSINKTKVELNKLSY